MPIDRVREQEILFAATLSVLRAGFGSQDEPHADHADALMSLAQQRSDEIRPSSPSLVLALTRTLTQGLPDANPELLDAPGFAAAARLRQLDGATLVHRTLDHAERAAGRAIARDLIALALRAEITGDPAQVLTHVASRALHANEDMVIETALRLVGNLIGLDVYGREVDPGIVTGAILRVIGESTALADNRDNARWQRFENALVEVPIHFVPALRNGTPNERWNALSRLVKLLARCSDH